MTSPQQTQADPPQPPNIPDGEELYNTLMQEIEPELTIPRVHALQEQYAGESPEEHKKRMERYTTAFQVYRKKKKKYFAKLDQEISVYKRQRLQMAEEASDKQEEKLLQHILDSCS